MTESILTTQQVADLFAVVPSTVVKWADSGQLPSFRTPGGHRRFYSSDVENLRLRSVPEPQSSDAA